jgi:5-formyltetrahydrofolate cyclo-ligase
MNPVRNFDSPLEKNGISNGVRKSKLRDLIKHKLMAQSEEERIRKGLLIKEKLFSLEEFKRAKVVMFYVSTDGEVDTALMIDKTLKMGKKVAVPLILKKEKKLIASLILDRTKELRPGPYGILQPIASSLRPTPLKDIDLVIVPGIAFDKKGNRLGRGKGYYDRFLSEIPKGIPLIGLAFDFQLVDRLPHLAHDLPLDKVITA